MDKYMYAESKGTASRRKEKQESANLRAKAKGRQKFDDQSMVEKVYRWVTKERPYYQNPFTGEKVPPPRD